MNGCRLRFEDKITMASNFPQDRYNLLVEFAHKHLDFQNAELSSVLDMYGIKLDGPECKIVPLPNAASKSDCPRPFYILSFPIHARGKRYHLDDNLEEEPTSQPKGTSVSIAPILARCTLVRGVVELWGIGTSMESCVSCVQTWIGGNTGRAIFEKQSHVSQSWKITVHTLGSKYTREEQDAMRAHFRFLDFQGAVQMADPTNEFIIIRETELDAKGSPLYPRYGVGKVLIPENDARPPLAVYFGRVINGRNMKGRGGVDQYSLNKRSYLGPTSMDAELSFIMTNLGQVEKGSFCMDPFVGTGSILLSCALRGAYCMGTDIDLRVLRGRSKDENVRSNFKQYGLPAPELVRSDNAIYHRHYRPHLPLYDAIICDPPYGIRAGARKTGSRLEEPRPVLDEHRHDHIAQTKPYPVSDVMADLLDMAARTLVMNGRLVYIIPSFRDFDVSTDLPQHTCLEIVHICYQPLSAELGRRMVTMKKIQEYNASLRDEYLQRVWKNGPESAERCANIRDKIIEAAKLKPHYEEKALIRKQKRKATREAKKRAKLEAGNLSTNNGN